MASSAQAHKPQSIAPVYRLQPLAIIGRPVAPSVLQRRPIPEIINRLMPAVLSVVQRMDNAGQASSDEESPGQYDYQAAQLARSQRKTKNSVTPSIKSTSKKTSTSEKKIFGINVAEHVRGDIFHFAATAASLPGSKFLIEGDPFHNQSEVAKWMHFLELNGAELQYGLGDEDNRKLKINTAGEATLSLVQHGKKGGQIGYNPAVFHRPYHTDKYLKQLLETKCPDILLPHKKVLVWVRQKHDYATFRNTPTELLQILAMLIRDCNMIPILIGDRCLSAPKGCLDLMQFWNWEEEILTPTKIRKRPFSGADSMQRQLMFLQLLRKDYGVCAQTGVKSGAMDAMGLDDLKTIAIDLEPKPGLRIRMARFAAIKSNYYIIYPECKGAEKTAKTKEITFPDKLTGTLVLHDDEALNPNLKGTAKSVSKMNPHSKSKKQAEYDEIRTEDWGDTVKELLKK